MAGAGYKSFTPSSLASEDVNTYLMQQSVMVFASSAARSSALPVPTEGMVSYLTDTNQLLVWNGTAWVIPNSPAQNPQGLELIAVNNFSASSQPFINGCFTSAYDNYKIIATWYGSVATNLQIRLRYSTNTTQSGNQYYRYGFYYLGINLQSFNASNETQQFFGNHGTTAGVFSYTDITMFNPNLASNRTYWDTRHFDAQSGLQASFSSQYVDTTQYTGFELNPASGTVTGKVSVYGYRNS